ncbi:butyrophilin subfamily 3 member A2-like [Tautogolabrus adspersus]
MEASFLVGEKKDQQASRMHHMTFFITFLLLLPQRCEGLLEVIGSPLPILAIVGDDIILPCHLKPAINAASETVEWTRPDLEPRFVHVWRSGQELLDAQHPSYEGRTSLFINELKNGNISLKLSKVRLSDKGKYRCFLPTSDKHSTIELVFGSVSLPTVSISKASSGVVLQCESEGWYPEPEVLWQDSEGILLSAGSTETVRGPDGLYTVSSKVTVERRPNNMFTCRVTQNNINQTREAHIHVPDELFMVQSSYIILITICVGVCVVLIVAVVVLVVRKHGQNKKNKKYHEGEPDLGERQKFRHDIEHQLVLEKGDRNQPMTGKEKMKLLDNIKAEQDDKLEKKEEELEHVQQEITTLTEQKKDLEILIEKLTSLQQEDKVQIEKNRNELNDTYFFYLNHKKTLLNTIDRDSEAGVLRGATRTLGRERLRGPS